MPDASKMVIMPWPATHLMIAEKSFQQYFSHLDRRAFLIGTAFPDIRYPAGTPRDRTHLQAESLPAIQSQPAFKAGLSFHNFVDELWNQRMRDNHPTLFSEFPHNRAMIHTMKILQDGLLYHEFHQWDRISQYFTTILPEEKQFGIDPALIDHWHRMLSFYLSKPPNINDIDMLKLSLPENLVQKIRVYYQTYHENQTLTRFLADFYFQFEGLVGDSFSNRP